MSGTQVQMMVQQGAQMDASLAGISQGTVSIWNAGFRSVTNFAMEHTECTIAGKPSGTQAQSITFHLSKAADLATDLYLEVKCPGIRGAAPYSDGTYPEVSASSQKASFASYVWGLGYAMISHAQFLVSNHSQEDLNGDYMEMHDELHGTPGKQFQESVFKYDNVTMPELAELSQQGPVLYVPIPFWWTKGAHAALPVIALNCYDMDVRIHLRSIDEIFVHVPDSLKHSESETIDLWVTPVGGGNPARTGLDWNQFSFTMWMGSVFLDTAERNAFANGEHSYIMKTVQSYHSYSSQDGHQITGDTTTLNNVSWQYPTSGFIWAIADPTRRASTWKTTKYIENDGTTGNEHPFHRGVRAFYGVPAHQQVLHSGDMAEGVHDFNVLRSGATSLGELDKTTITGVSNGNPNLMSSSAVAAWNNKGLNNCPHLWGNPFDYRMSAAESGSDHADIEPLHRFTIQVNSQDRVHPGLDGSHYRVVQGQHFNNIPRKGIYCYSFALNASSPFPQGTINFSRIDTINMTFETNPDYPGDASTHSGKHSGRELLLFSEHFNIWKVAPNSVGRVFG